MVRRETRQMNEREAAVLQAAAGWAPDVTLRGTVKWLAIWTACLIALGVMAYGLSLWTAPPIVVDLLGTVLGAAGILSLFLIFTLIRGYIHWSRVGREFRQTDVPAIQAALRDATVQVTSVRATAVATIEQFEDEGDGFIFDVGNGQLLVLKGQRYWPVAETMPWPNSEFEIVRSTVGNRWIGIFCSGNLLKPITTLRSSDCKDGVIWSDREDVVNVSMEEFVRSIRVVT